jgi:protein O-mannosyl-transferase
MPAWIPPVAVGLLAIAVYVNSLPNGFITDDQFQILNNPVVKGTRSLVSAFGNGVWAFLGYRGNYYRPLQFVVWAPISGFWAEHAAVPRVDGAAARRECVLVYQLVRRLPGGRQLAAPWAAAALFAVHPIHAEAVNWIAALPDVLVTTFVLVGLSAFAAEEAAPNAWQVAAHVCLYLAALLTKETGVMMLPLYIAYRWLLGAAVGRYMQE